ncbi:MAG: glycosyltransferase [Bacteroides stercoris]
MDSLFSQTVCPDEVILVKDGPIGDELDNVIDSYVTRYPYLKVLSLVTNRGLGKALNEGLKYCSHELVARMDTDDIAMPERFEKQLAVLRAKHPDIDAAGAMR